MNDKGKLNVFKQEMVRMNINVFGISELKWIGMSEFNSDDHSIYYCGQESLRRNGIAFLVNKSPKCNLKNDNVLSLFMRQIIQQDSNSSLCLNH